MTKILFYFVIGKKFVNKLKNNCLHTTFNKIQLALSLICILFFNTPLNSQKKIGLVLSGGGATGFVHIGVIRALEEHNIPIDYITGTSAGALIGGMYASGYTPNEMVRIALSDKFQQMANGEVEAAYHFYFKDDAPTSSMFKIRFSKDSLLRSTLPTNLNSPSLLDFEMMRLFAPAGAVSRNNFDSLMIPFRCVASDVQRKEQVIFKEGNINEAIRASMTYPFYLKPIMVDGVLLFDGGLYNNFPADVMYNEFNPDFIIGSNVSSNEAPPDQNDLLSQVKNMLVSKTKFSLPCEAGIMIEPETNISTFDFNKIQEAINLGYETTIALMDSIKKEVFGPELMPKVNQIKNKRNHFRTKMPPFNIAGINVTGVNENQAYYIKKTLQKRNEEQLDVEQFKKRYFRLNSDQQIGFIYPTAIYNESDSSYHANIHVNTEKEFSAEFGGHFSSRPVNTGFIALKYQNLGNSAFSVYANSYFGKFYGSTHAHIRMDLPTRVPMFISPQFTMNRWDYFRSFATFFEDVKPSFLVQNELYTNFRWGMSAGNKGIFFLEGKYAEQEDLYYQTQNFTNKDTADNTEFISYSVRANYTRSTLNRKQFASAGTFLEFDARYISGKESTFPGSTSAQEVPTLRQHNWFYFKAKYINYFMQRGLYRIGIDMEGVYTNQDYFSNYTASLLVAPTYNPIPDANTYFLSDYRAHQYASIGLMNVFTLKDKLDFRLEGYLMQPIFSINPNINDEAEPTPAFDKRFLIFSSSMIYHSFLGPIRATFNYFNGQEKPFAFQLSFGYVLFNDRALR